MTTNKPPIAAWAPSAALAKLASRHNNSPCVLTDGPAEFNDVPLIRLSDYKRLQAETERLQVEKENLRQEVEALQGIQPEMPPMPPNGKGLPRYGVRWNGPTQPLSVPKDDGYWTPWHLAQAESELLRAAIRRLCNIYVVDDYYDGQLREDRLDEAVNRAINAVMETPDAP